MTRTSQARLRGSAQTGEDAERGIIEVMSDTPLEYFPDFP